VPINFSSAESSGFTALEAGLHDGVIFDLLIKGPGPSGFEYLEVTVQLPEVEKRRFWKTFSFHPKSLPYLQRMLVRFGFSEEDLAKDWDDAKIAEMRDTLLGRPIKAKLTKVKAADPNFADKDGMDNDLEDIFPADYAESTGRGW